MMEMSKVEKWSLDNMEQGERNEGESYTEYPFRFTSLFSLMSCSS